MTKFAALFVRKDSSYKKRAAFDAWDFDRDALNFQGGEPVVCHPPCRSWGALSHMATNVREGEAELALWSIDKVRENGGILEHPKGSKLFGRFLPKPNEIDEHNGFTILIDQYDFGHVAHKLTYLYFVGLRQDDLPPLPPKDLSLHYCDKGKLRSIAGNVKGTTRCTQYQREYTPDALIDYFEATLTIISKNKGLKND